MWYLDQSLARVGRKFNGIAFVRMHALLWGGNTDAVSLKIKLNSSCFMNTVKTLLTGLLQRLKVDLTIGPFMRDFLQHKSPWDFDLFELKVFGTVDKREIFHQYLVLGGPQIVLGVTSSLLPETLIKGIFCNTQILAARSPWDIHLFGCNRLSSLTKRIVYNTYSLVGSKKSLGSPPLWLQ